MPDVRREAIVTTQHTPSLRQLLDDWPEGAEYAYTKDQLQTIIDAATRDQAHACCLHRRSAEARGSGRAVANRDGTYTVIPDDGPAFFVPAWVTDALHRHADWTIRNATK